MKQVCVVAAVLGIASCAHLPGATPEPARHAELWHEAHMALYAQAFAQADSLFDELASIHTGTEEGREAVFYVGAVHIDPRNPAWNPERAETALREYLQQDTVGSLINRRPEATTLLELARQLNLPPDERMAALRGDTTTVTRIIERRVTPTDQLRELVTENTRLRRELVERDDQIRRQREELDRIRRALTPRSPP